jgi:hypothetical protein
LVHIDASSDDKAQVGFMQYFQEKKLRLMVRKITAFAFRLPDDLHDECSDISHNDDFRNFDCGVRN